MSTNVLADGVPIDCGGMADALASCYGPVPAVGIAVFGVLSGIGLAAYAAFAMFFPQVLDAAMGIPATTKPDPTDEAVAHGSTASDPQVPPTIDPVRQQRLDELRAEFVELVSGLGCDGGKAAAIATYQQCRDSIDDFIRGMEERAIGVVRKARSAPEIVKADLQKLGIEFAFRRQGLAGAPGEFGNVFEYYMSLWVDKRHAALEQIAADAAAGIRPQPTRKGTKAESARTALAELQRSTRGAESALYRDRANVEALNRAGVTADPALTDDQLVAHIRAQADQLTFSSTTAAAYHARVHRNEIPENRREMRAFIANYHAAAERVVREGRAQFDPGSGGGSRKVCFIVETTDDQSDPITLTVIIRARADGRVVMSTFGSFLKN
ncbi:hypothetical protein [Micromonospora echinofusca]|uniref:Uncharacterized protein n=1 Tax=Micromonospora echinofusca TaxID=47858 RepID=A0ABS3VIV0_MICEH|nr:hypothetical protein [Micromonospora echinofusca]MBO4204460.1 hypothetical protein [Micromonospora echinofusca]